MHMQMGGFRTWGPVWGHDISEGWAMWRGSVKNCLSVEDLVDIWRIHRSDGSRIDVKKAAHVQGETEAQLAMTPA